MENFAQHLFDPSIFNLLSRKKRTFHPSDFFSVKIKHGIYQKFSSQQRPR